MEIATVLDLLQHYPRRYHDRTQRAEIAELKAGDEATIVAEVKQVRRCRTRQRRDDGRSGGRATAAACLHLVFFNQPWREKQLPEGTEVAFFGKLDVYRRQAADDEPDRRRPRSRRRRRRARSCRCTRSRGRRRSFTWELRELVADALARDQAARLRRPARRRAARASAELVDRTTAYRDDPPAGDDRRRPRGAAPARASTSSCACRSGSSRASARSRRSEPASRTRSTASCVDRVPSTRSPFALTGDQTQAIDEIAADLAAPVADAPAAPGRGRVGQDGRRARPRCSMAVQGGYQGAFMAPTEVLAEQHYSRRARCSTDLAVPSEGTLLGERPVARRAAHQPHRRGRARAGSPRGCARARSTSSSARTRCSTASAVHHARAGGDRRAAPLRRRAARAAARQGRRSPTCS